MGNEMGNSNTSGLQEEENSTTQVGVKPVQEAGRANGAEVENHSAPVTEGNDYHQKENRLASDVPNGAADPGVANQILDGRVEEETEVQSPAEFPKVEVKSNSEASDENSEIQPHSVSNDSKYNEKPPVNADGEATNGSSEIHPNSTTNDSKDHEEQLVSADGEGENHIVSVAEDKDYQEKEIDGFSSAISREAEDPHIVNQISDESEQGDTEVHAPAESSKSEVESNSAGADTSDVQPTSPSKHSKDQETPQESKLEENLQQISDDRLEKQSSIKQEEDGTKNSTSETISSSHDPEPQEFEYLKFVQPKSSKIHADPPIQDSNGSLHEEILESNLNCTSEENGHPIGTKILKDMDETIVSGSNLGKEMKKDDFTDIGVSCEDRLEIQDEDEIGDDLSKKSMIKPELPNGDAIKCCGEIPIETCPVSSDFPGAEPEVSSTDESPNPHLEFSESTDNCVVLAAEIILIEKESQHGEDKPKDCPTQSCEDSIKEPETARANLSQSEFLMIESDAEDNHERTADFTCGGGNEDCIEAEKVAENGHLFEEYSNDQIEASLELSKDSQKKAEMVVESEIVLTESSLMDCKREEVSEERQMIEEIDEKTKASNGIGNSTEGRESREKCVSPTLTAEQEEVSLPRDSFSLVQSQENQQNNEMQSKNIHRSENSMSELKQEDYDDIIFTEASCFDSKNLMAETLVSVAELAIESHEPDLPNHTQKTVMAVAESGTQENHHNEECARVEMPAFASDDYQAQESVGRFSTESNPNNSNTPSQMQKSPSFDLDLRIEARTEESDRTPLLYQDKTAIEDFSSEADVSLGNPIAHTRHDQNTLEYQAMPEAVEEKVVRMERSDSEKSKTPFLGFLKEEEEAHIIVTPQKHDSSTAAKKGNKESLNLLTKEVASTSPKSKEKRKARSSLFTNCMCCTTVIN